jgi:tRNA (guanine6-N2)-methyltransferase
MYYITVFPGLAAVAVAELQAKYHAKTGKASRVRGSEILPVAEARLEDLLESRIAEDVFIRLGTFRMSGRRSDLTTLAKLPFWRAEAAGRTMPHRSRFRVVVQADDAVWRDYRRIDLQTAAEAALMKAWPGWRLASDAAPLEIWLHQVQRELWIGLRASRPEHRSRGGRTVERAAALRPTIAAAMVWLSRPMAHDVFLDPMCGSGTILLERAVAGRYAMLIGGDSDPSAVQATLQNFGPRHQPRKIERMDARALPLDPASVDVVATNLPWGHQIGEVGSLPQLYQAFLKETERVLKPGGRLVMLTSEVDIMRKTIQASPVLNLARTVRGVEVLGRSADIFVLERS